MARPPSVFVRDLEPDEARRIRDLARKGTTFAQRQRAQIVLASASHMSARQIADVVRSDENQVRRVIHDFNTDAMASLHPRTGGGRPRKIDEPTRAIVMDNLSTHWTPAIRAWAADTANNVALLATPTYASHLNRVECQFWSFVEFVIRGSDYPDWATFDLAAKTYIRRRNRDHHDPRIRELECRRRVA